MKIDTLGVQAFIAIAEHRSFQKAARSLHLTQTALSRRLGNLEASLGVRLVERTTRSVALSRIGEDFLPQARRLLGDLASALVEIRETGKAMRGDVTIACVPTVGVQYLPRIVQAYAHQHPGNRIRVLDHASANVADAVLRREAEFGINIGGAHDDELHSVPLLEDRYVLVCRDDHPLADRQRLRWAQLAPYPLIFAGPGSSNRPLLDGGLGDAARALRPFFEVQRSATALGLVAAGAGVAVVPRLALQKGAYPMLRTIALVDPVVSRTMVLIRRRTAQLTPAAQALYDLFVAHAERR